MENFFQDILNIEDIQAVVLLTAEGKVRFRTGKKEVSGAVPPSAWNAMVMALNAAHSAEVVFEQKRIYFHRFQNGYIVVIAGWLTPMAMVRLKCGPVATALEAATPKATGLARFFRRSGD